MALPTPSPTDVDAYCVKCKASRKMSGGQIVTTKNGKSAVKGKCPVCGTTMMKFLSSK
jgi:hypothetical protein